MFSFQQLLTYLPYIILVLVSSFAFYYIMKLIRRLKEVENDNMILNDRCISLQNQLVHGTINNNMISWRQIEDESPSEKDDLTNNHIKEDDGVGIGNTNTNTEHEHFHNDENVEIEVKDEDIKNIELELAKLNNENGEDEVSGEENNEDEENNEEEENNEDGDDEDNGEENNGNNSEVKNEKENTVQQQLIETKNRRIRIRKND